MNASDGAAAGLFQRTFRGCNRVRFARSRTALRSQSSASTPSTPSMFGGYPSSTQSSAHAGSLSQTHAPRRTCRRLSRSRRATPDASRRPTSITSRSRPTLRRCTSVHRKRCFRLASSGWRFRRWHTITPPLPMVNAS